MCDRGYVSDIAELIMKNCDNLMRARTDEDSVLGLALHIKALAQVIGREASLSSQSR